MQEPRRAPRLNECGSASENCRLRPASQHDGSIFMIARPNTSIRTIGQSGTAGRRVPEPPRPGVDHVAPAPSEHVGDAAPSGGERGVAAASTSLPSLAEAVPALRAIFACADQNGAGS